MSFEIPDSPRQTRKNPGFTQSRAAKTWSLPVNTPLCWENRHRNLSTSTLAMLEQLLDEILDMDPPAPRDQHATGLSCSVGRWLPKADDGPSGDAAAGG
jgi:hypothetical protein